MPKVNHLETLQTAVPKEGPLSSSGPQWAAPSNSLWVRCLSVTRKLPGLISRLNLHLLRNHLIWSISLNLRGIFMIVCIDSKH